MVQNKILQTRVKYSLSTLGDGHCDPSLRRIYKLTGKGMEFKARQVTLMVVLRSSNVWDVVSRGAIKKGQHLVWQLLCQLVLGHKTLVASKAFFHFRI